MLKENPSTLKIELRKSFLARRNSLSNERRKKAAEDLFEALKDRGPLLSFSPIGSEIDLTPLNSHLLKQNHLFLNRLEEGGLTPYRIRPNTRWIKSRLGVLEPDPASAERAGLNEIEWILVPGIAFDSRGFRLGYGMGLYDRFLKDTGALLTVGAGFKERLSSKPLPRESWDIAVKKLLLL